MTVVISSNGVLGNISVKTAVNRATPSYGDKFLRPRPAFIGPGWDRHVEEVNGRAPGHTQLCDMPGSPPCDKGSVTSAFAGLGQLGRITNAVCSDHTTELEQLDDLLGEADRLSLDSLTVKQAQTYVARFNGVSWQHPMWPATCTAEVSKARALYKALNAEIRAAGGTAGVERPPPDSSGPTDITGTIKTVAIAGAIIAGVVLLFPIVKEGIVSLHLFRAAKR